MSWWIFGKKGEGKTDGIPLGEGKRKIVIFDKNVDARTCEEKLLGTYNEKTRQCIVDEQKVGDKTIFRKLEAETFGTPKEE